MIIAVQSTPPTSPNTMLTLLFSWWGWGGESLILPLGLTLPYFLLAKNVLDPNLFDQNFFVPKNFVDPKKIFIQFFFTQNLFEPENFLT